LGDVFRLICLLGLFGHVLAWFTLPTIFSSFCFSMTSAGERPWRPSHETKSFILTSCFTGGCWTTTVTVVNPSPISPTQLSSLQNRESGGDRFIEYLRRDLCGVLNVSDNQLHHPTSGTIR